MNILMLVTDAYGAGGGIAQANRDLIEGFAHAGHRVTVLARASSGSFVLPAGVRQPAAESNRLIYSLKAAAAVKGGRFDAIFCGHLYMCPLAGFLSKISGVPYWLHLHGIEAWNRPSGGLRRSAEGARLVTSVSRYTRRRFLSWAKYAPGRVKVLPDTVGTSFLPGVKDDKKMEKLGLKDKAVILTVGRLASQERYKGHDRVIEAMSLLKRFPEAVYLIAGDGDDRARIENLAKEKGMASRVRFLGKVEDSELPGIYRLADVFAMPSTGEGFGIAFLEAMFCGVPAVGGNGDGSSDPLRGGLAGQLVDPSDAAALAGALEAALEKSAAASPQAAACFAKPRFESHLKELTREI